MNRKTIFVVDSYSRNVGDVGILTSLLDEVASRFPNVATFVEASHPHVLKRFPGFKGKTIHARIFNIERIDTNLPAVNKILPCLLGVTDAVSFLVFATVYRLTGKPWYVLVRPSRRPYAVSLVRSTLVISAGGGFLSSRYHYIFRLLTYGIALLLRKEIVLLAQSIGPLETRTSRILIPYFLKRVSVIVLREPDSRQYIQSYKLNAKIKTGADTAFALRRPRPGAATKQQTVTICVKAEADNAGKEKYINAMVKLAAFLNRKRYAIVLISHTPPDDMIGEEIIARMQTGPVRFIPFGMGPRSLKAVYGSSAFTIASRMHAIVFAAAQHVPFVALAYEPKFAGLFTQLHYDQRYLIPSQTIDSDYLLKSVNNLIGERHKLADHLRKNVPAVIALSRASLRWVKPYL